MDAKIYSILAARLKPFKIADDVIEGIRDDIMRAINTPQAKKHGATIMTPEASMAGDKNSPFYNQAKPQTT